MRAAAAIFALCCAACAGASVPSSWSFRNDGHPVETDRARFHAAPPEVKAAIEQELVRRGFTLARAEPPYEIVAEERTDCGGAGARGLAFEWQGRCSVSGPGALCRRRGIAVSLDAEPGGTSARMFVRSLAWMEGAAISASVDETFEGCIPREEDAPSRREALELGAGPAPLPVFEAVREQLEKTAPK